jgi:hypothetical protein
MKKENEDITASGQFRERGHFLVSLRAELIKAIEGGTPRSVIVYEYGVSRSTLSRITPVWAGGYCADCLAKPVTPIMIICGEAKGVP